MNIKQGVKADLGKFAELMEPLRNSGKLFALLIQLPPSLKQNLDLLENFLKILPSEYRYAIEFRHKSWWNEDTWRLLRKYNVANTILDEPPLPPDVMVTADFAYLHWHGHNKKPWYDYQYSPDELKAWVPKVKEITEKVKTVYGYFNNHYHSYAVENCLQILEMPGLATPKQSEEKTAIENYIHTGVVKAEP